MLVLLDCQIRPPTDKAVMPMQMKAASRQFLACTVADPTRMSHSREARR